MSNTTDTTSTTDPRTVIDGYFECWNATSDTVRGDAIRRTWAPDAHSSDPVAEVTGHEQLAAMFAQFHATYPGSSFRQNGGVDAHHNLVRWGWEMIDADGVVAFDGFDVAVIDDGRIAHLAGFFGYDQPAAP
jgi:hypothetical protein